jgi:hypothetical protein
MTRTTRAEGIDLPHSIRRPSRLPSSITLSVRKVLPSYVVSCMKSIDQILFSPLGAISG